MKLMAGFDMVLELSNETVLKLIRSNLSIGGTVLSAPFELSLPLSGPASGYTHMIVTDLRLDLNEGEKITLSMPFDRGTVVLSSPLSRTIGPLSGTISITTTVSGSTSISFDLANATAALDFTAAGEAELIEDLSGTILSPALFKTLANQALTSYAQTLSSPPVPLPFTVVPGIDGTLTPALQLERVEVRCIPNADRKKQALGIFGILLAANHGNGNHTLRTEAKITTVTDGMCFSLSPEAFHSLIFAPAMVGLDLGGMTLNSLTDTFADNHIDINGSASKSGTCYDATATFHGSLTLSVSGSLITPQLTMDPVSVDVDIPWYCYLASAVVGGILGPVILGVIDALLEDISVNLGKVGISSISLGNMGGASFSVVQISPEGLSLQGRMPIYLPGSVGYSHLELNGSVITTESTEISSGIWHGQAWCMSEAKDYPFVEYHQQQRGMFDLKSILTILPLTPVFMLKYAGHTYPLTEASGTITIPNMTVHYPKLGGGGTALEQPAHISYTVSGTQVVLTNIPTEGTFSVSLHAQARDCDGGTVKANGEVIEAMKTVVFVGIHFDIGGEYAQDVQYCVGVIEDYIRNKGHYTKVEEYPKWPPKNYPSPEDLLDFIQKVVRSGYPAMDQVLINMQIAHGGSFHRAILSPAARTISRNREEHAINNAFLEVAQAGENMAHLQDAVNSLGASLKVMKNRIH